MKKFINLISCSLLIFVTVLGIIILPAYADISPFDSFDCSGKKDGNYQIPSDPTKFISCSGGIASVRDCAPCNTPGRCINGRTVYTPDVDACLWTDDVVFDDSGKVLGYKKHGTQNEVIKLNDRGIYD